MAAAGGGVPSDQMTAELAAAVERMHHHLFLLGLWDEMAFTGYLKHFGITREQWLDTIRAMWPGCPARIDSGGDCLIIAPGCAVLTRSAAFQ